MKIESIAKSLLVVGIVMILAGVVMINKDNLKFVFIFIFDKSIVSINWEKE